MYADDIVLLSTTAAGLQEKLNKLRNLCHDWCLEVNVTKTKVLIFNKAGRLLDDSFTLMGIVLKMLDITVTWVCTFQLVMSSIMHKTTFFKNSIKASFKLTKLTTIGEPSKKQVCIYLIIY